MPIRDLMTTVAFAKHALMFRISSRKFLYGPCRPYPSQLSGLQELPLNSSNGILWYVCVLLSLPQYLFVGFILFTCLATENTLLQATKPRKREKKMINPLFSNHEKANSRLWYVNSHILVWSGQGFLARRRNKGQCSVMLFTPLALLRGPSSRSQMNHMEVCLFLVLNAQP